MNVLDSNIRYWITDRSGNFVNILIDPYLDIRIWVKITKNDKVYSYSDYIINNDEDIDIFILSNSTPLYSDSEGKHLLKHLTPLTNPDYVYHPLKLTKESVLICKLSLNSDRDKIILSKPIGWIRIRDKQNRIAVLFYKPRWD